MHTKATIEAWMDDDQKQQVRLVFKSHWNRRDVVWLEISEEMKFLVNVDEVQRAMIAAQAAHRY